MNDVLVVYVPVGIAAIGVVVVVTLALRARSRTRHGATGGNAIAFTCSVCQKELHAHAQELDPLAPFEVALCGRSKPELIGRKLAQYQCPHCEASHYFTVDVRPPRWVGANLYSPQTKTSRCHECGRVLEPSPWPEGTYDGRLHEAPQLPPGLGLVCPRCASVSCVHCVEELTHGENRDGTHVCPRCRQRTVHTLFRG